MVAIFTGLGAGFERGSRAALGGAGLLGAGVQGRAGDTVSLNAANGNLILTQQDEFLAGLGPDVAIGRTYNSQGALNENGDGWRQSTDRRVYNLTGTLNTTGSTITRVSADGSEIAYTYNSTAAAYIATDGAGAYDKLVSTSGNWTWTDGTSQFTETYLAADGGYISSFADTDGNALAFTYVSTGKLDRVTTANGEYVQYSWSGTDITAIVTHFGTSSTITRATYGYDSQHRLTTVTVDLTPDNTSDSSTYTTTYAYVGTTNLLASITQSDGSSLTIQYNDTNHATWVTDLIQLAVTGDSRTTHVAYVSSTQTNVTDPRGQVTSLYYNASGQLTQVTAPPAYTGATSQTVQYAYDSNGNVTTVTDPTSAVTTYTYDANGNIASITDANGNVITRSYDSKNALILETRTASTASSSSASVYTRYVYDSEDHLRFVISAEGRVTEYRYDTPGNLQYTIDYPDTAFTIGSTAQTEAQMQSWVSGLTDLSNTEICKYVYDGRGDLSQSTHYGAASTAGVEATTEGYNQTVFVYDQAGRLLQRTQGPQTTESFAYDGLGRLTASTDLNGATTTIAFNDAATTTTVTTAAGLTTVSTYNKAGDLLSSQVSGTNTTGGTENFVYDKDGQLRKSTDATGKVHYFLYDEVGRKVADIGQNGEVVEYRYDQDGRLIASVRYVNLLSSTDLAALASNPLTEFDMDATHRPTAASTDVWAWTIYDTGGRVIETIAGDGAAVKYEYDASNRLIKTTLYVSKLSVSGFISTPPTTTTFPTTSANDAVTRAFYDGDGNLLGSLNAQGFVTRILYDSAGRRVQTIAYANAPGGTPATDSFSTILGNITANASADISTRLVYDGQGLLRFTIDALNHVTEIVYRQSDDSYAIGLTRKTIQYATALGTVSNYKYATIKSAVAALASSANDRVSFSVYNSKAQLAYTIDASGAVVGFVYDAFGRVIKTTQYATLNATGVSATADSAWVSTMDTWASGQASNTANRITRTYYSERGDVRYVVDAEGYITQNDVDAESRLTAQHRYATALTVTDSTTLANIASASKGTDSVIAYGYDAFGRVSTITDQLGTQTTRSYYANGLLQDEIQAAGSGRDESKTRRTYDQAGHVLTVTTAYGATEAATTSYVYDGQGNVSRITDARGNQTNFTYDKLGHVLTKTDAASGVTSYQYNGFGNVKQITDARGNASVMSYDKANRVIEAIDAEGYHTRTNYTAFGEVGSVVRFSNKDIAPYTGFWLAGGTGLVESQEPMDGGEATVARNSHGEVPTWDTNNAWGGDLQVLNGDRSDGRTTVAAGDAISVSFQAKALDAGVTIYGVVNYLLADGSVAYSTQVFSTSATFSTLSITGTAPANAVAMQLVIYSYRPDKNINGSFNIAVRNVQVSRNGVSHASGPSAADEITSFAYDKLGRLIGATDAAGASEAYSLNAFGQRASVTSKLGATTSYAYDHRGLLTSQTVAITPKRADGTTEKLADGVTDATSVVTSFSYDSRGNRTQMLEAANLVSSVRRTTNYAYNLADQLTSQSGDAVQATSSAISSTSSVTPTTSYVYDLRGNVIQTTDALGAKTLNWYDKLDRLIVTVSPRGTVTTLTYDANGNVTDKRVYATLNTSLSDASGSAPTATGACRSTQYTYDALNRATQVKTPSIEIASYTSSFGVATQDLIVTTQYDAMGNVVKVTDANGNATWSYYDKLGRKTTQIDALNYRTDWIYDADSNVTSEKRYANAGTSAGSSVPVTAGVLPTNLPTADSANDRTTTFTYDKMGRRLTEVRANVVVHNAASPGTTTTVNSTVTYTYNALGEVLTKQEATGDTTTYHYDATGRMEWEKHQSFNDYTSVSGGTQHSVTPETDYLYDGLNNLVRTVQRDDATLASPVDHITQYVYGAGGRLASVTDAEGFTHTYRYDADGRVTRDEYTRQLPSGTSHEAIGYDYDAEGRVIRQGVVLDAANTNSWSHAGAAVDTTSIHYNAFGEVSQRGLVHFSSGNTVSDEMLPESFDYDGAGRLWRTTSGDGTSKYFMYDAAGNQTLMVASTSTDISAGAGYSTIDSVLNLWGATRSAIGTTNVSGVVATITRYDARGSAIEVKEPQRDLTASTRSDLSTTRAYNAFGEVIYEINALSARVDYTYNTMGRLIQVQSPSVQAKGANGYWISGYNSNFTPNASSTTAVSFRPVEYTYFDASGRRVAARDANGNLTQYTLLAGSGYGGKDALVSQTKFADNNTVATGYDIFGNARKITDQLARVDTQSFDKLGRITQLNHASGLIDYYRYDGFGHRIRTFNSFFNPSYSVTGDPTGASTSNAQAITYDAQGRVTQTVAQGGDTTTYAYAWDATIATTGMGTFGGWQQTTTYANSKTLVEKTDYFNHNTQTTDLGGHVSGFTYNKAGLLTQRSGGSALNYSYFNSNRIASASTTVGANTRTTSYEYDVVGDLTKEVTTETGSHTYENATATYDALGRLLSWSEAGSSDVPPSTLAYEYDAKGNIRHEASTYRALDANGAAASTNTSNDYWYTYDALDRVVTSPKATITYDAAGQRAETVTYFSDSQLVNDSETHTHYTVYFTNERDEFYTYDSGGRVTQINAVQGYYDSDPGGSYNAPDPANAVRRSSFSYDALGRLSGQTDYLTNGTTVSFSRAITLNAKSQVTYEVDTSVKGSITYVGNTTTDYGTGTSYALGAPLTITTVNYENGVQKKTTQSTNTYAWWGGAVSSLISYKPDTSQSTTWTSTYNYTQVGGQARLDSVTIADGRPRTVSYRTDLSFQVIRRDESDNVGSQGDPHEIWYRFGGRQIGYVGNNGTANISDTDSVKERTVSQGT
ncbi:MAG: DUF6531 domain-containing protein, partial [Vitreimonas sp.]